MSRRRSLRARLAATPHAVALLVGGQVRFVTDRPEVVAVVADVYAAIRRARQGPRVPSDAADVARRERVH